MHLFTFENYFFRRHIAIQSCNMSLADSQIVKFVDRQMICRTTNYLSKDKFLGPDYLLNIFERKSLRATAAARVVMFSGCGHPSNVDVFIRILHFSALYDHIGENVYKSACLIGTMS